jgi:hypothetical protein
MGSKSGTTALAIAAPEIGPLIAEVRGQRVILDGDLARIYGVPTKALNQAVKRNAERFPEDFCFRLTLEEAEAVLRSRSQFVTLKRGANLKYLPNAFTEHGAIMAANVLNSAQAIQMSVFVVRAFIKLREMLGANLELARKLGELEARVGGHDEQIAEIIEAVRELMSPPPEEPKKEIGFHIKEESPHYRVGKKTAKRG